MSESKLKVCIKEQLDEKGISRYKLAKMINVTYPTITALYHGTVTSIRLETLEKLCQALVCTPNDILVMKTGE